MIFWKRVKNIKIFCFFLVFLHFFGFLCLHLCDYFCKLVILFILKRGGGCQSLRCLHKAVSLASGNKVFLHSLETVVQSCCLSFDSLDSPDERRRR